MSRSGHTSGTIVPEDPGRIPEDESVGCLDCPPPPRGTDATFRVPDPRSEQPTIVALCPYHLRALQREEPMRWHELRSHPAVDGLERATAHEHVLVDLADLPEELPRAGTLYQRLGLDETGSAYFATETGVGVRVLQTDESLQDGDVNVVPHEAFRGLLDHVDENVGWRGLERDWIEKADGWSS